MIKVKYTISKDRPPTVAHECEFFDGAGYLMSSFQAESQGVTKSGVAEFSLRPLKGGTCYSKEVNMCTTDNIRKGLGGARGCPVWIRFKQEVDK